jgi:hypothetical protein
MPTWTNPHLDRATIEQERGRLPDRAFREQYGAEFFDVDRDPCDTCGGPRADAPQCIDLAHGQTEGDLKRCPDCDMFVDESGRCIVKYWNPWCASVWVNGGTWGADFMWDDPTGKCQWPVNPWS